jgi:crossover junction endodeoxyribonuclease RusA
MPARTAATPRPWRLSDDDREISFEVLGRPQPKGSLSAFALPDGRARITEPRHHKAWQREVRDGAVRAIGLGGPLTGPLWARLCFFLPRPKSAPKTARTVPAVRPDLDKLLRASLDGLIGVAIHDDSQIVLCEVGKFYSSRPRVTVRLRALSEADLQWEGVLE